MSPQLFLDRDALVEDLGRHQLIYGRWDRLFGFWHRGASRHAAGCSPATNTLLHNALAKVTPPRGWPGSLRVTQDHVVDNTWKCFDSDFDRDPGDDPGWDSEYGAMLEYEDSLYLEPLEPEYRSPSSEGHWHDLLRELEVVYEQYLLLVPPACRAVALAFPATLRWQVLGALWAEPSLLPGLEKELLAVGSSYLSACLLCAPARGGAGTAELLRVAMSAKRTGFLSGLLGVTVRPSFLELLKRSEVSAACPAADLVAIAALAQEPRWAMSLRALPRVSSSLLTELASLPGWTASHLVARAAAEYPGYAAGAIAFAEGLVFTPGDQQLFARYLRRQGAGVDLPECLDWWVDQRLAGLARNPLPRTGGLPRWLDDLLCWYGHGAPAWARNLQVLRAAYAMARGSKGEEQQLVDDFKSFVARVDAARQESVFDAQGEIADSLAACADREDLAKWRGEWGLLLSNEDFPAPPISPGGYLDALTCPRDILDAGQVMENCLGLYHASLVLGLCAYYYVWNGEERAAVELRRSGGKWHVGQLAGFRNAPVSARTAQEIEEAITGGVQLSLWPAAPWRAPED